jgi:iron complex outermembrane receptor protein
VSYLKAAAGGGHRGHSGVGLELQLPLLKQWQLNLAGRYDDYQDASDVGGAVSPRVTLEFRPTQAWVFYGSAGRSFRAPDMQRLFGGQTSGFVDLINTKQCLADGGARRGDASVASCVTPVFVGVTTSANLHLQEERGNHYSFGVNWKPSAQWSASLDYFSMNLRQLVQTPDGQYVLDQNALNGSFANAVIPFDGDKCPFTDICLNLQPLNISYKKVSGIDAAADYQWDAALGTFSAGLKAGYLIDVSMRESALRAPVDVLRNGQLGEAARLKGGIDLGWQRHAWASNIYLSYTSGFTPLDTTTEKHLGSFTTVNCSVRYTLSSGAIAQLGVNNVFDRMPPVDIQRGNLSAPFYHQQFHNVDGASWYASLRQPF